MDSLLPQTYLIGLICVLAVVAILVGRQFIKVRREESNLIRLEKSGANSSTEASELYELASVQIRKRLYPQATSTLKKALARLEGEPEEAKALIENALGFSLAAQDKFEAAIGHYRTALKAKSDYPVALNNLAFVQQRLLKEDEAYDLYKKVLAIDPKNQTALKQIKRLQKTSKKNLEGSTNKKGF
tara:strand:+ start:7 stop:564 length:558 start_codon:yes stop_codon:yes gene_type:complete